MRALNEGAFQRLPDFIEPTHPCMKRSPGDRNATEGTRSKTFIRIRAKLLDMVPDVRIERTTYRLQGGCSTTELIRRLRASELSIS